MSRTALVTGANRGIGFGLVQQFALDPSFSHIFATTRAPEKATELQKLVASSNGRVHIVHLEINKSSISQAAVSVESTLQGKGLDILVNNIGIAKYTAVHEIRTSDFVENFEANVVSVQLITDAFLPLLHKGKEKKIVNVSSAAGSISVAPGFLVQMSDVMKLGWAPYPVSKAALNMLTALYSQHLGPLGFTVIPISPGLVNTDLLEGDQRLVQAAMPVEASTSKLVALFNKITPADNGKFYSYDGTIVPW